MERLRAAADVDELGEHVEGVRDRVASLSPQRDLTERWCIERAKPNKFSRLFKKCQRSAAFPRKANDNP